MIGYLRGTVKLCDPQGNLDQVILDVSGVGYVVTCPRGVVQCGIGEATELWIQSITREDGTKLYGFAESSDIQGFVQMLNVQGVGAKVALALIAALGWQGLLAAISVQDSAQLIQADGVGKKLAERITHELSAKLGALGNIGTGTVETATLHRPPIISEATSALTNLGYSGVIAQQAVQNALADAPDLGLEDVIAVALRSLSTPTRS